ncbi:MAG TPA: YqjK family protein [Burkholderiales bacterium]|jgi:hypothetical protein|nr:YqjK family protein [Burkholderiales bacterium]
MLRARAKLLELAERRSRLIERARTQREQLAHGLAGTDAAAVLLARALRVVEDIRQKPLIVAVAVALLVALRPRRALGWLMKGWSAWRLYRGARRVWQRLAAGSTAVSS